MAWIHICIIIQTKHALDKIWGSICVSNNCALTYFKTFHFCKRLKTITISWMFKNDLWHSIYNVTYPRAGSSPNFLKIPCVFFKKFICLLALATPKKKLFFTSPRNIFGSILDLTTDNDGQFKSHLTTIWWIWWRDRRGFFMSSSSGGIICG